MSSELQERIRARIEKEGAITFADYMRMALYEPGHGYYVTAPFKMGWEGDYFTSTDVSDFFANCMGRQIYQMWDILGKPMHLPVLEQGAGRGDLVRGVQSWAAKEAPELKMALDYRIADINSGQDALRPRPFQTSDRLPQQQATQNTTTIETQGSAQNGNLEAGNFTPSIILSNELVDAFPVHLVEKRGEELYEVYIELRDGRFSEVLAEPSNAEVATYLDSFKIPWRSFDDGWRAEVNLDALRWIERTAKLLLGPSPKRKRRGFVLAIDYGDTARKLYSTYRYRGTLTTYYQHQMTDRPLAKPGEQDITAHVNFSALINEGRRHGLRLHTLTTQRQWLTDMGIYDELEQIHKREFAIIDQERASDRGQAAMVQWFNLRQRVSTLTDPHGMGAFKILIMKH